MVNSGFMNWRKFLAAGRSPMFAIKYETDYPENPLAERFRLANHGLRSEMLFQPGSVTCCEVFISPQGVRHDHI